MAQVTEREGIESVIKARKLTYLELQFQSSLSLQECGIPES